MAEGVSDRHGSNTGHGSVLGGGVRCVGSGRVESVGGERAGDEESTWAKERCAGMRVVEEAAHVWIAAEFVPATGGDSRVARSVAIAGAVGGRRGPGGATDAEGTDGDEPAIDECAE